MRPSTMLAATLVAASPALAQTVNWGAAEAVTVQLSSFAYTPATVRLRAGQPVRLTLVNAGSGGHDFSAPEFFAAASVRPEDRVLVRRGSVEVGRRSTVTVSLVPRAGRYRLRCTHFLHSGFGMTGEIVVE